MAGQGRWQIACWKLARQTLGYEMERAKENANFVPIGANEQSQIQTHRPQL